MEIDRQKDFEKPAIVVYDVEVSRNFGAKIMQEKLIKLTKILNYIMSSCIMYWAKMFGYFLYIYTACKKNQQVLV